LQEAYGLEARLQEAGRAEYLVEYRRKDRLLGCRRRTGWKQGWKRQKVLNIWLYTAGRTDYWVAGGVYGLEVRLEEAGMAE
jgi:hypothetical protein